jgi:hypothetical protein
MNNLPPSSLSTTTSSFDSNNQHELSSTIIITTNSSSNSSTTMSDIEEETTATTTTDSNKRQKVRGSPVGSMARTTTSSSPRSFVISTTNNHVATTISDDDDRSGRTSPTTSTSTSSLLQLPTFEELSKVLCAIVDTDHYSRNDAIHALKNLARWGYSDNITFLSNFSELGGIQRVLLYLKNNKVDPQCVMISAKVIMSCTHRNPHHNNNNNQQQHENVYNIANEITRYFTMRDGIRILLDAGKQYNHGGSVGDHNNNGNDDNHDDDNVVTLQLQALRWIWMVLMNVTEKSSTFDIVHKDQLLAIFDSGLETMTKLGKNLIPTNTTTTIVGVDNNNNSDVVRSPVVVRNSNSTASSSAVLPYACGSADFQLGVVQRAFSSFCSPSRSRKRAAVDSIVREQHPRQQQGREAVVDTATAVGTNNNTKKPEGNVNTRLTSLILEDMFITLLNVAHNASMTRDDFQGMDLLQKCIGGMKNPNGEWIDDKELLVQASCFFVQCSKKQILSTKEDYEVAFPLIVECISKYPEESFRGGLFDLVRNAYTVVDKAFIRGSGIFGAVAAAWESTHVNEATKDASHQLLKELL